MRVIKAARNERRCWEKMESCVVVKFISRKLNPFWMKPISRSLFTTVEKNLYINIYMAKAKIKGILRYPVWRLYINKYSERKLSKD